MKDLIRQFMTFCGVGVINTIVGLTVILVLSEIFHVHYMIANVLGYAVGLCVSFTLNRRFTFAAAAQAGKAHHQAAGFLAMFGIAYLAQFLVLVGLVDHLGLPNLIAQIIACGTYTIINFIGNRFITFRTP